MAHSDKEEAIAYLRSPTTIRSHCGQVLALAREDKLSHFRLQEDRLEEVVAYVLKEIDANYPDGDIPYHSRFRHFNVGGIDRIKALKAQLAAFSPEERGKVLFELAITSVLLDAGAGKRWQYLEKTTGQIYRRSEGLAIASLEMFGRGVFSAAKQALQADANGLRKLTVSELAAGLQVHENNALVGLEGRTNLLKRLGEVVVSQRRFFGEDDNPRLGKLFDYLINQARPLGEGGKKVLSAKEILLTVLQAFSAIWPQGYAFGGSNLGDIGVHPLVKGPYGSDGLVPFHKLSQWMTYSLFEPLEEAGVEIRGAAELTGLPEYRNGGLLLDTKLLLPKQKDALAKSYSPQSEFVVEWRALTVALLDLIAVQVRRALGKSDEEFPLVKVLQGGTWSAGRRLAKELRVEGGAPVVLDSDGTVF